VEFFKLSLEDPSTAFILCKTFKLQFSFALTLNKRRTALINIPLTPRQGLFAPHGNAAIDEKVLP
jgi:hypothetical protein